MTHWQWFIDDAPEIPEPPQPWGPEDDRPGGAAFACVLIVCSFIGLVTGASSWERRLPRIRCGSLIGAEMKTLLTATLCLITPALGEPYGVKVNPPICEITIVERVYHAPGPPTSENDPFSRAGCCSSGITYVNGKHQNGEYSFVPGIEHSRPGDRVKLCLVSFLAGCPEGDDRGKTYWALNLRTHEHWTRADSSHMCGGA
jgi:hypothetical protein